MESGLSTYAVVVYHCENTTIGERNIHFTVAPTPFDALRFAVASGFLLEEYLQEAIYKVQSRLVRPIFSYGGSKAQEAIDYFNQVHDKPLRKGNTSTPTPPRSPIDDDEDSYPPLKEIPWENWKTMFQTVSLTHPATDDVIIRVIRISRRYSVSGEHCPFVLAYLDYDKEPVVRICNAFNESSATAILTRGMYPGEIARLPAVWKYHRPLRSTQSPAIPMWIPPPTLNSTTSSTISSSTTSSFSSDPSENQEEHFSEQQPPVLTLYTSHIGGTFRNPRKGNLFSGETNDTRKSSGMFLVLNDTHVYRHRRNVPSLVSSLNQAVQV